MRNIWWKNLKQSRLQTRQREKKFLFWNILYRSKLRKLRQGVQVKILQAWEDEEWQGEASGTQKRQGSGTAQWEQLSVLRVADCMQEPSEVKNSL